MKKAASIGFAVILALVFVTAVSAFGQGYGRGFGPGYGRGFGPGYCWGLGPGWGLGTGYYTPEQAQKAAQFQKDNQPLFDRMFQLRSELVALRAQTPTDWNAIAAKQREMFDLRMQIQQMAVNSGVPVYGYGPRGRGMGWGPPW